MDATPLRLAREVLASQPFSALLGTRVSSFDPGRTTLELDVNAALRQQHGFVHGGVLAYLVDNAMTFAGGSVLGSGVVTVEIKVNYLRPAAGDGRLIAEAAVVDAGKNQAVCRCEVHFEHAGQRRLVAAGQGTIRKIDVSTPPTTHAAAPEAKQEAP